MDPYEVVKFVLVEPLLVVAVEDDGLAFVCQDEG